MNGKFVKDIWTYCSGSFLWYRKEIGREENEKKAIFCAWIFHRNSFKVIICHFFLLCLLLQHFSLASARNELCLYLVEQIERSTSYVLSSAFFSFFLCIQKQSIEFSDWNLCLWWCAICQQGAVCLKHLCIMIYRISKSLLPGGTKIFFGGQFQKSTFTLITSKSSWISAVNPLKFI